MTYKRRACAAQYAHFGRTIGFGIRELDGMLAVGSLFESDHFLTVTRSSVCLLLYRDVTL